MKKNKPFIKTIFIKFLNNEDTPLETKKLFQWVKNKDNSVFFKLLIKEHFIDNYQNNSLDAEEAYAYVLKQITKKSIKVENANFINTKFLKYAAAIIILFTTLLATYSNRHLFFNEIIEANQEFVSIKFNSDAPVFLKSQIDTSFITLSGSHKIIFNKGVVSVKDLKVLNMPSPQSVIKVPFGKKINVLLHDNSLVNLNSGSTFIFPADFKNQLKRTVSIEGEGFFEVSHLKDKPFEVVTPHLKTTVYGTAFNIKSFREDINSEVVLVNGAVGVTNLSNPLKSETLFPSDKATLNKDSPENILVEKVNVSSYISWKENILIFDNISMDEIILNLQRTFNVEIDNHYKYLENKRFTGKFERLNLEFILKTFQTHTPFEFSIKDNKVVIDKTHSNQIELIDY